MFLCMRIKIKINASLFRLIWDLCHVVILIKTIQAEY